MPAELSLFPSNQAIAKAFVIFSGNCIKSRHLIHGHSISIAFFQSPAAENATLQKLLSCILLLLLKTDFLLPGKKQTILAVSEIHGERIYVIFYRMPAYTCS